MRILEKVEMFMFLSFRVATVCFVCFLGNAAADPHLVPLADTLPVISSQEIPAPGGYFSGLTKPLVVDVSTRIWGPGITTPPPGGIFHSQLKR